MELKLVKCKSSDLDRLIDISRSTFIDAFEKDNNPQDFENYILKAFNRETIQKQLENPQAHFYFVYEGSDLVGYFKVNEALAQSDVNDPESLELERIYVCKEHQGKQIGKYMLEKIEEIARNLKALYLWLGVWEENEGAIRFYEKNGYSKFGSHPYVVGTDVQTDWLMKKDLI